MAKSRDSVTHILLEPAQRAGFQDSGNHKHPPPSLRWPSGRLGGLPSRVGVRGSCLPGPAPHCWDYRGHEVKRPRTLVMENFRASTTLGPSDCVLLDFQAKFWRRGLNARSLSSLSTLALGTLLCPMDRGTSSQTVSTGH